MNPPRRNRVLIVHPFGIGDALFITPLIRALKENGAAEIDLLLGSRTREVFSRNPHVRAIYEWDKTKRHGFTAQIRRVFHLAKLFLALRQNRYQAMLDCSLTREYAFLAWLFFRIPERIGFNFKGRGAFLTRKIELPEGFSGKPVAEFYLDLSLLLSPPPCFFNGGGREGVEQRKQIPPPLSSSSPPKADPSFGGVKRGEEKYELELYLGQEDHDQAVQLLRGLNIGTENHILAAAPGGGESWGKDARLKRWPVPFFAALIRRIFEEPANPFDRVLIVGSSSDAALGEQLIKALDGFPVSNLAGRTSVRTAAALLERCALLIANDGGLVHLAHAAGTPVIALYGPVDPAVYGPYPAKETALAITNTGPECRPCYRKMRYQADCEHVNCLNALAPDRVWARIQSTHFLERILGKSEKGNLSSPKSLIGDLAPRLKHSGATKGVDLGMTP